MEELSLENKLLEPLRDNLEESIKILTKTAITAHKESEISLKINIKCIERFKDGKKWLEPEYEYTLNEKIKESKSNFKDSLGFNYSIELDDENVILVKNINEQESLFDEEREEN